MRRILFAAMAALMLLSAFCFGASAKTTFETGSTVYSIPQASEIICDYSGVTGVTFVPQGGSTADALIDGDAANDITHFNEAGIVLVRNDYIKPTYVANNGKAEQSLDAIPTYSFTIGYDSKVTFDAVYVSFMHEINECIATPGNNQVVVEYSDNGKDWHYVDIYFYRPDLPEYTGTPDAAVEEHIIPLGKEISASYVRMTFDFKLVPETTPSDFWTYYTNVYEWCGFTELGVAAYESGDEPRVMTQEESLLPDVDVVGVWVNDDDEFVTVYTLAKGVVLETVYDSEEFAVDDVFAEPVSETTGTYNIYIDELTFNLNEDEWVYTVSIDENGALVLDDGYDKLVFEAYAAPEKPDISSVESSVPVSSDVESDDDAQSKPATTAKPNVNTASLAANGSDAGISTTVIIIIVVAAVVVIGAVVAVVVVRSKKK